MTLKEIIIKIVNRDIYFNPNMSIPCRKTNLQLDQMTFKSNTDQYWRIELIQYLENTKCFHVRVLDYNAKNIENFRRQTTNKLIESVIFENLDWQKLRPLLSSYSPEVPFNLDSYKIPEEIPIPSIKPKIESYYFPKEPVTEHLNVNFSIKFQEATFKDGAVIFKKFIKKVDTQIDFKIENSSILEEFDNIKLWFSKKLKTKKFNVSAIITLIDKKFSNAIAASPEIEMITPNIIENVKYDRTIALTKPPRAINPDKSLYTTDDIFQLIDPEIKEGNVFNQSEPDIIKSLTKTEYVRNRKQLEYLSDIKQTNKSKIHYTLNPLFGFLFLNESKYKYHFVWELLQSHATYIWSINKENKDINSLYEKIEEIINVIKLIGRDEYKRTHSNKNFGYEFNFKAIDHQDININFDDGFKKWKNKLDEILV
jgi:hypothetical protein